MKILMVHNSYQLPGGEDQVFAAEANLLESRGHDVIRYCQSNHTITGRNKLIAGTAAIWNPRIYREISDVLRRERPAIVHVHNSFPIISPAVYYAARTHGSAVVQTLHNYRLLCPGATVFRNGRVCEKCVGEVFPLPAVRHACYRGSVPATTATAIMLSLHRIAGTWKNMVEVYITLSEFARSKFVEGGLPSARIVVKPNFIDGGPMPGAGRENFGLFVGRLAPEKGIATLTAAFGSLSGRVPLEVIGDGPLGPAQRILQLQGVLWRGWQDSAEVMNRMRAASFLVLPSIWYEGFPVIIAEAYSVGLPVIASKLGSLEELVHDGETGLHFEAGNAIDLARKVEWAYRNPEAMAQMGRRARVTYENRYTSGVNYASLLAIYKQAIDQRASHKADSQ